MLRSACSRLLPLRLLEGCSAAACGRGAQFSTYSDDHVMLTEQEQGHILEKLEDPEEVQRMLAALQHRTSSFGETMADTIVRETLEARKAGLEEQMKAKYSKVLCEHGHEHDVCCGAAKGEAAEGEV